MKKRMGIILLLSTFIVGGTTISTSAEGGSSFTIRKTDSGGAEAKKNVGYFDLLMKPGEKRTITTEVSNRANKPITVNDSMVTAYTNSNGEIERSVKAKEFDPTLTVKMHEITSIPLNDVSKKIKPNSHAFVKATISVPKSFKKGVLLGTWHFEEKEEEKSKKKNSSGTMLHSKYTMSLGVKVTVGKEIEKPNVNLLDITAGLKHYRKAIFAEVQNDQPAMIGNVKYEGSVCEKGKFDPLYSSNQENAQLAPNSSYKFPVLVGDVELKPGEYTYRLTVTSTDPKWDKKVWNFTKDFTLLADETEKLNKEAINDNVPDTGLSWWLYAIIALLGLFILFLLFVLFKRRKKGEEEEKEEIKD